MIVDDPRDQIEANEKMKRVRKAKAKDRRKYGNEKSVQARVTRVMKTKLKDDEVELQAEPQAIVPALGLAGDRGRIVLPGTYVNQCFARISKFLQVPHHVRS